jgi:hypothetical protein
MEKKWIEGLELCSHWNISKHDLADMLNRGGVLQSYDSEDFSSFFVDEDGRYFELPYEGISMTPIPRGPMTGAGIEKLIFRKSEVEEYEKKHGMTPGKKTRKTDYRKTIISLEAKALRQDYPEMDRIKAMGIINKILGSDKYSPKCDPIKQTQFNRITKDLGFPIAKPGNPHNKTKKQ